MCGRFILNSHPDLIDNYFGLEHPAPVFQASYNIPPSSHVPVVWQIQDDGRACSIMHWGLIPHWAKTTTSKYKMINAKAETLSEKPAFRLAYQQRRCLIPTSGFYEWHATAHGKHPYYIGMQDHGLFAFAGLWEYWEGQQTIHSFTIITTVANKLIADIHDRMPVIIDKADFDIWLDPTNQNIGQLNTLLIPNELTALQIYPVSTAVNNPRNDTAELIKPAQHSAS